MAYIFLDESGDLGFDFSKKKTSRYFLITCLFIKNKGPIEKLVKKIFQGFAKKEIMSHCGVLHAFKEKPATRQKLLAGLAGKEVAIVTIYLNKTKVYTKLHNEKHVLYNYVANILLDRIYTKKIISITEPIKLVASYRETNKFLNQNFRDYLTNQISNKHKLKIAVEIKYPHQEKCLQAADFVCWALFRKHEHGDESYANIIKQKVVEESPLFP